MRRDLFHYFEADLITVFKGFKDAIQYDFKTSEEVKEYYEIKGGLPWGWFNKYNMNGGVFVVHFMPYETGTAIAIRYVFAKFGARYGAYDQDLIRFVEKRIAIKAKDITLVMEEFLKPENMIVPKYKEI